MFYKNLLAVTLVLGSSFAAAEVRPYLNVDLGFADSDYGSSLSYDAGAGIQFNEHIEFEVAYNNYGSVAPYDLDATSTSFGLNIGGKVSEKTRVYAIVGSEKLEVDGRVRSYYGYSFQVNESSDETYYGIGTAFEQAENIAVRTKLVSHSSGDIISLNVGIAFYF